MPRTRRSSGSLFFDEMIRKLEDVRSRLPKLGNVGNVRLVLDDRCIGNIEARLKGVERDPYSLFLEIRADDFLALRYGV